MILEEILLDFRELQGEHSGANLAKEVWESLVAFGIQDRIMAIASDNASNNDTMMKSLQALLAEDDIMFDHEQNRIRCVTRSYMH